MTVGLYTMIGIGVFMLSATLFIRYSIPATRAVDASDIFLAFFCAVLVGLSWPISVPLLCFIAMCEFIAISVNQRRAAGKDRGE